MAYTEQFLISELHRFVRENDINPIQTDMQKKFGYPSYATYTSRFGSWNNALIEAGLNINQINDRLDGTETCDNCGKLNPENRGWYYKNGQRLCIICSQNLNNYKNGNLDPESNVGFAFISQRVVAETLELDLKYDCNCTEGFGAPDDLYDANKYKYINVKTAVLFKNNYWQFDLKNKYTPDTYIMLGFSSDKSNIKHVWITEPEDDLTFDDKKFQFKQKISVTNSEKGLKRAEPWEVDCEPYNNAYHNMSLENCTVLRSD